MRTFRVLGLLLVVAWLGACDPGWEHLFDPAPGGTVKVQILNPFLQTKVGGRDTVLVLTTREGSEALTSADTTIMVLDPRIAIAHRLGWTASDSAGKLGLKPLAEQPAATEAYEIEGVLAGNTAVTVSSVLDEKAHDTKNIVVKAP